MCSILFVLLRLLFFTVSVLYGLLPCVFFGVLFHYGVYSVRSCSLRFVSLQCVLVIICVRYGVCSLRLVSVMLCVFTVCVRYSE